MVSDDILETWFCSEVLPNEGALTSFIRNNWRVGEDVVDLRHDIYELAITGARRGLPDNARAFLFAIARNHLINRAKRSRIVSFDLVSDLEAVRHDPDMLTAERYVLAREALKRAQEGIDQLSPRVRQIVLLRKVDGLNTQETAARLGIGIDAVERQLAMGMKALADFMLGGSGKIIRQKFARKVRKENGA
ncbi:RNA polymerase sigma factor [Flavisphingomonas formosensis]|uniref:RNA polymerase sigma factor n=1 Tax=Flavisphingomonas formosensis TaxID=861534 RepID=UPI0012FC75DD|nr:RNA polymerase sigma factor [Sphingomonas formosensis]